MADETKIILSLETILRGLEKTLRGLDTLDRKIKSLGKTGPSDQTGQISRIVARNQQIQSRAEKAEEQANLRSFQRKLNAVDLAEKQRTALVTRESKRRVAIERDTERQNLRNFQQRISRLDLAERQRTAVVTREAATRVRVEKDAERENLRNFQQRIVRLDRFEQQRIKAEQSTFAKSPQVDAHVQDFKRLEQASRSAADATAQFNARIQGVGNSLRSIGQGLASVGISLTAAVTAPLAALGVSVTNAAVTLDSLRRGLTAIVGSSAEAESQLRRLTEIAKLPGIGFEEAIQGSIRLQAVGFSAEEAEKSLRQFANAIALTGGGREELSRVTVQLGQLAAKGKVLSQDLRPIIEAAPAVGRALLEAFGTVNADDIQELGLSSKEFLSVLTNQLSKLPRAAAGAKNAFENFRDTLFRAAAEIGEAVLPILSKLIDTVGPAITALASAFRSLPAPLQTALLLFGGLAAAVGPVLFIVGQLTTGVGRLIVGFAQLSAAGILPTVRNLGALTTASVAAAEGQATLAASTALVGASLLGIAAILGAIVVAYIALSQSEEEVLNTTKEQIAANQEHIKLLKDQLETVDGLSKGVKLTADEQEKLSAIYRSLNTEAQARVQGIRDEEQRLIALRAEIQRLLKLRQQEREQQIAQAAAALANTQATIDADSKRIQATTAQIQSNTELASSLEKSGKFTDETVEALRRLNISGVDVGQAIQILRQQNERLVRSQNTLRNGIDGPDGLNSAAEKQAEILRGLGITTVEQARQYLTLARNIGLFKGDVEATLPTLERFIKLQKEGAESTDAFTRALSQQTKELLSAGERADDAEKSRRKLIGSAASLAKEASQSFKGALQFMQAFIAANPDVRAAIEKERQLAGKSFDEFVRDALGEKGEKRGTALRNAQELLAQATEDVARASADAQREINKNANEQLLQQNESNFKLQLVAYRQYLNEKTRLTNANLDEEIKAQSDVVTDALVQQQRFLDRAGRAGLPIAEKTKAEAGAARAEEDAIKAGIRINDLRAQQKRNIEALDQTLAESAKRQVEDVRKLRIEYGELTGRIEEALNAATDEKFAETLKSLALAQDDLNKRLEIAKEIKDADAIGQLTAAQNLNQQQVELSRGIVDQERATNNLAAANILVQRAKERQQQLEQEIATEVEFRGLKEIDAVNKRLAGEERLRNSLLVTRDIVQETVDNLALRGVTPPQALLDFIRDINLAVKGLGEIGFSEQFRLAETEFQKLNDARVRAIQDVERAVRHRDIAEIEGRLLVKKLNGEYVDDLERQAEVLRGIADKSGQKGLQRQAADAEQLAKDVRAATTEVASFGKQLRSVSLDSLRDGFAQFFKDLTDQTTSIKEDLLGLVNSVTGRLADLAAESLSDTIFSSDLFKGLFGVGEDSATDANTTATQDNTNAINALITTMGGTVGPVSAIGSALGGKVGGLLSRLSSMFSKGFATGDIIPAAPTGKIIRVAEGGYDEAVLTTDPKHAMRQAAILNEYLKRTRGLYGRFKAPEFASGGIVEAEQQLLSTAVRTPSMLPRMPQDFAVATAGRPSLSLRNINVFDKREVVRGHLRSAEGAHDILNIISENADDIGRRIGVK